MAQKNDAALTPQIDMRGIRAYAISLVIPRFEGGGGGVMRKEGRKYKANVPRPRPRTKVHVALLFPDYRAEIELERI